MRRKRRWGPDLTVDPDYEWIVASVARAAAEPDDRLTVFRLSPLQPGLPPFVGRWHSGVKTLANSAVVPNKKSARLKVDIEGVDDTVRRLFENGKAGYRGHYPEWADETSRSFELDIRIPGRIICRATISFNLDYGPIGRSL